jgi:cyclopropane fatty-acyl-phospholipid synthase-like methyltransferase
MSKPYALSCDRNREPILAVLREHFVACRKVLEIGSGTGQHAVYFAAALPHLIWQCSEVQENLIGIQAWLEEAHLPNTPLPVLLDVKGEWPVNQQLDQYDAAFSANTLHIMHWLEVEQMFARLDKALTPDAVVAIYGPFNYGGRFTSDSNAAFNDWLQARGTHMAIRDFEAVNALAAKIGLQLIADAAMPANNRTLVWRRLTRTMESNSGTPR